MEEFKRKLTAILSADVEGYSRLMGEDEDSTVRTLKAYRELIAEAIQNRRGRVVDSPGDNVLAEFGSVVDAVRCAVEIQEKLKTRNAQLPENRQMKFRIGVNLGDVIQDEERIYGDGVNIAARVEGLAEGEGICISGSAYEQIKNKMTLGYEYLGEHAVKNIAEPVPVYRVLMEPEAAGKVIGEKRPKPRQWRRAAVSAVAVLIIVAGALAIWNFYFRPAFEPASVERMAYPLPDKPSIAVLPFANLSGDPEQEYLSDGITEQIITGLSKIPKLFVIARNSSFTYKGKPMKVKTVAEELGVKYVLEGSVQKSDDRVRITAQLIDATKGHHLWSETYDRDLSDIFALQDEIMRKIMDAMVVKLTVGEQARVWRKASTENIQALEKGMQGLQLLRRATKQDNAQARKLIEEAIALDSDYIGAYTLLAFSHLHDAWFGWSESRRQSMVKAFKLGQKALAMDETQDLAHSLIGQIYLVQREYEKAIAKGERAIALNPNSADAYARLGFTLTCAGRHSEAVASLKIAVRLNPLPPAWYLYYLGIAYRNAGQYDEAIIEFKNALRRNPDYLYPYTGLASCYILLGHEEEARGEVEELLNKSPTFSLKRFAKVLLYKNPTDKDLIINALRKAGLPETPPLPLPDKPSIAVLPFTNLSDDPKQEYFVDGMTDDLITDLSQISGLFVIARNSVFRYKGKPVDVKKVSRELGVRYVLEGSVRKAGGQVRINAQLIDATTAGHLWAKRYDGKMTDVFALQDEITKKIVRALAVQLTSSEEEQIAKKETESITAYDSFLKARAHYLRHTPEDFAKALSQFENTIETDPNYRRAYFFMALIYSKASKFGKRWLDALDLRDALVADGQAKKYLQLSRSKIVFVTSAKYTGNLGGVAGADAKCQQLAEAALLPGTYKAWLSDKTSSPATTFTRWKGLYVLVDGTEVASKWEGLTEKVNLVPIKITETGQDAGGSLVWTNTAPSGGPGPGPITREMREKYALDGKFLGTIPEVRDGSCQNWTSSNGDMYDGLAGHSSAQTLTWTYNIFSTTNPGIADCDELLRLYCFQQ